MGNVKYAPFSSTYGKIEPLAVETDEIMDHAVTIDKLGGDVIDLIVSGGAGGDVNIPDGADIALGAKADPAWDESSDASVVSILKRAVQRLASIATSVTSLDTKASAGNTSTASIDTKLTTTNTNTGNAATSLSSVDTKLTTTNTNTAATTTALATTNTNTGNIATATGAQADAAWVSGSGSIIALLKNLAGALASLVTSNSSISTTNTTIAGSVSGSRVNTNILRTGTTTSTTIANGATDSAAIDISTSIAGGFMTPSAMTGTSLTYKVSYTTSGFVPLYDQYGNLVTTPISTSQSRGYPFPQEAAGYASLVLVSNASEGAIRTFNCFKKG